MTDKLVVRIERQDGPDAPARWEEFHVERRPNANVISVLMQIQRDPRVLEVYLGQRHAPRDERPVRPRDEHAVR